MGKFFGTDGVRGVANTELTPELVYELGRAGAFVLTKETKNIPKIIVGMDTRISGDMLEAALIAGICSVGAKAVSLGVVPTPAVAHLVREYNADAGVVISASHNPVKDNGIKFFNSKGFKLPDETEARIEEIMTNSAAEIPRPVGEAVGSKIVEYDAIDDYIKFLKGTTDVKFTGLKVAIDCANGATYKAAPIALHELGAEVCAIHREPDGTNINKDCGSTHMESLKKFVIETKSDVGIAFDGDGDRCLAIDENGELVDGDQIMAICGSYLKELGKLKNNTIVATVMSNLGLFIMGDQKGINIEKTKVGDRYVLERMLEKNDVLGGEQSGHIIFLEHNTTGDGILTAIQLLSILKKTGKKLSELKNIMEILPQVLINAAVDRNKKDDYLSNDTIKMEIEKLEKKFEGQGRVLIRPSGTEPIVRVMLEGRNKEEIEREARRLADLIEELLK
ncbi:MAG: phosphoglucosamine mutase [Clostridiales bacterium]|nr:phosphoglucosamine mutase [Clostridiales bacterium]